MQHVMAEEPTNPGPRPEAAGAAVALTPADNPPATIQINRAVHQGCRLRRSSGLPPSRRLREAIPRLLRRSLRPLNRETKRAGRVRTRLSPTRPRKPRASRDEEEHL